MSSVVMIAHDFPPEGSAGAYRPLRFVRRLPAMGWNPSVVCTETDTYERYDPALLEQVPGGIEVVRVAPRDPWLSLQSYRLRRVQTKRATGSPPLSWVRRTQQWRIRSLAREAIRSAEAWCYHPDMAMGWIRPAVEATVRLVDRMDARVIWATAGPVSSFIVAEKASIRTGVPYVLDFRDAWTITYNEFEARRPAWATRADRRALRRILAGAQAVTFRYQTEAECYWRSYPGALDPAKVHILPNGFDGDIEEAVIPERGERCKLVYSGTLSSYRYDTLLQALAQLKERDAAGAAQLRLVVVGEGADALDDEAMRLGVADMVETSGPIAHADVENLQRHAHALLVLGRPPAMKGHELFAGAKLFGYLRAARPIIGVLPSDETKRILRRVGVSTIADGGSVPEIVAVFKLLLEAWSRGTLKDLVPDRNACAAYSAERQTAALVHALEARPAAEPFVPNSVEVPPSLSWEIATIAREQTPVYT